MNSNVQYSLECMHSILWLQTVPRMSHTACRLGLSFGDENVSVPDVEALDSEEGRRNKSSKPVKVCCI